MLLVLLSSMYAVKSCCTYSAASTVLRSNHNFGISHISRKIIRRYLADFGTVPHLVRSYIPHLYGLHFAALGTDVLQLGRCAVLGTSMR